MNPQTKIDEAEDLFRKGRFSEAKKTFSEVLEDDSTNYSVFFHLGQIALFSNELEDVQKWLTKAINLEPKERKLKSSLAEVYYRQKEFLKAAPLFRDLGREPIATNLESFKEVSPYQIEGDIEVSHVGFVITDPLPVIQVQVYNSEPVNFFIDTGGAEVIIDTEYAQELGIEQFGTEEGTFAGGIKAGVQPSNIGSLKIGDFTINKLPIRLMPVRQISKPIFGERRIDGIIGTTLLYQFLATLDYPGDQLILRRKTKDNQRNIEEESKKQNAVVVPFWMAGDHFMVAWGRVNDSSPLLFFVDTGMAGGGFTCPNSTIDVANIELRKDLASEGIGGGGKVTVIPFQVKKLYLGEAIAENIQGLYMSEFTLESSLGFHIGGLISHQFFRGIALTIDFMSMKFYMRE